MTHPHWIGALVRGLDSHHRVQLEQLQQPWRPAVAPLLPPPRRAAVLLLGLFHPLVPLEQHRTCTSWTFCASDWTSTSTIVRTRISMPGDMRTISLNKQRWTHRRRSGEPPPRDRSRLLARRGEWLMLADGRNEELSGLSNCANGARRNWRTTC
jgi:hypothetical protein